MTGGDVLIVVPTLNEAAHIGGVLAGLIAFAKDRGALIVVADGGSADATRAIVGALAADHPEVVLMDNPGRLQSAGINLAVARHGAGRAWLIRVDAHSHYPADYCATLLDEALATGADSVVVRMTAEGATPLQRLIALAQNSRFGNGGSAHRLAGPGGVGAGVWVDHGHHALMRLAAFQAVGGYDAGQSHNEDAELDRRLRIAGFRIWLTGRVVVRYLPRRSLGALARQYFRFGRGRAQTLLRHRMAPAPRQAVVAALAPGVALSVLMPLHPAFGLPLILWLAGCLLAGLVLARAEGRPAALWAGGIAGVMHLAWSAGFWAHLLPHGLPALRRGAAA